MNEALKLEENYTYADYAKWDDKHENGTTVRYELIDGKAFVMSAPTTAHQDIVLGLGSMFKFFLRGRRCRPYVAPFDVLLDGCGDFSRTVVQPDVVVICDPSKITKKGCNGVPDIVVEVLSPSSNKYDKVIKFISYQNAGVKEYWIVDIENSMVDVAVLGANKKYTISRYTLGDTVTSTVLDGFSVVVNDIFADLI
jgi:Uma2 family endonuclease